MTVRVGIDVGGTFTDLALFDEEAGEVVVDQGAEHAAVARHGRGRRHRQGAGRQRPHPRPRARHDRRHQRAARAEAGRPPGLITTRGFRDIIFIQRMNRKHHYDLTWDKPQPFVERRHCLEVDERIDYDGRRRHPLDEARPARRSRRSATRGFGTSRSCFLFSYINPAHELRMREIIAAVHPDASVSLSHEVYPRWREYDRASTAMADAYLKTLVGDYVEQHRRRAGARPASAPSFLIMKSNGGIDGPPRGLARSRWTSSSPARSAASWRRSTSAASTGRANLISIDMGGTSFDVSLIADGRPNRTHRVRDRVGPADLHADGRRPHHRRRRRLDRLDRQGRPAARRPARAPAPTRARPATAGAARAPTVTDANLVLGRLSPDYFLGGADDARRRRRRDAAVGALAEQLGMDDRGLAAAASSSSSTATWSTPSGSSRSTAGSTRATSRWSPSAAPARCMPAALGRDHRHRARS